MKLKTRVIAAICGLITAIVVLRGCDVTAAPVTWKTVTVELTDINNNKINYDCLISSATARYSSSEQKLEILGHCKLTDIFNSGFENAQD